MTDLPNLIEVLVDAEVKFIIVGGIAGIAHGSSRVTLDVNLVYGRDPENLDRLAAALAPFRPTLRDAPPGLPFRFDAATLGAGLNFTLDTRLGPLDLLGEVAGGGGYEALVPRSGELQVFGRRCRVVNLDTLIMLKRAAGRPKDLEAIAELERLRDEIGPS